MEVSRKRPHVDNEDSIATKKRALTGPNGSPQVNGVAKEEFDADNLELFRKEAIYRRMKHYSRENDRCQSRIEDLEKRKQSCEVGLAAMTACWNQLVKTIRLLIRTDDLPEVTDQMFNFTVHIKEDDRPDFTKALEVNLKATENLVTRLFEAGGNIQTSLPTGSTFHDCQKEISDRISLQTQLDLAHANLRDAEKLKEKYYRDLQTAESRLDRLRSQTVTAMHSHTREQRPLGAEEALEESKPSSPAEPKSPAQPNGIGDPIEIDTLRAQVASREARISELEQDVSSATFKNMMLEIELKQMSYERIVENPHYKSLLEHAGVLQASLTASRAEVTRLTEESNNLRASRIEWEESVINAANQANQELKIMLTKRDSENSRLREQREQQAAELIERKQQDNVKMSSVREMKALNDSRLERITALESEVARAKACLAANAGDEDLMKFFMEGQTQEIEYFKLLKERAAVAERRVSILEQSLSKYQEARPDTAEHLKAETDALQKLAEVQAQLDKYKRVYGDASGLPPDTSALAEQLRHKEEEVQTLRLRDVQHTQAETSLYTELEKLSTAWESLERQVKDKVFDLSNLENQLKKATSEKAKSENKYYAAMRDKDAVSAETTRLQRNVEKQNKVVERLVDAEKNLTAQLSNLEKELATVKTASLAYKERVETLTASLTQWSNRCEAEQQRANEASEILESIDITFIDAIHKVHLTFRELEKLNSAKRVELRKLEDGLIRTRKEFDAKIKQQESAASQGGDDEHAAHEQLLSILKCSACKEEFRSTVITKCMHTFCRSCIDTRISTRQRKCPACGLGFAQSDVLYGLYFQ